MIMHTTDALKPLIERLDEPYRMLCRERYVEGRSAESLATEYMLPVDAVQQDLSRGRLMLLTMAVDNTKVYE